MLKSLLRYWYVDDELALYVPDAWQGSPVSLHSRLSSTLTQRSLLPVSMWSCRSCAGVPRVTFIKYSVSSLSSSTRTLLSDDCLLRKRLRSRCIGFAMSSRRWMWCCTTRGAAVPERFRLMALTPRKPVAATARVGIEGRISICVYGERRGRFGDDKAIAIV